MNESLRPSLAPLPTICVACGTWFGVENTCPRCGALPRLEWRSFYELALRIDEQIERGLMQPRYRESVEEARRPRLAHGWMPEILSVVSAFVLGILTNAGYDAIKAWLLSDRKRDEAKSIVVHLHYHHVVELVSIYLRDHPELEEEVRQANVQAVVPSSIADEITRTADKSPQT